MRTSHATLFALGLAGAPLEALAKGECNVEVTVSRRPRDNGHHQRSVLRLETVELLDSVRPYVTMSEGCGDSPDAVVCLMVGTSHGASAEALLSEQKCHALARPRHPGEPAPADATLFSLLLDHAPDRLADFRAGDLGDATYFDMSIYAEYFVSDRKITNGDPNTGDYHSDQGSVRVTVALSHDVATLSLAAQPARAMFAFTPCRGATGITGGALPEACADGRGGWLGSINASAIGLKVFLAPIIRYPWVGWSVQASTGVLGYASQLTDASAQPTNNGGLFVSPLDVSVSLIDFRVPSPVRVDVGLFAGAALVRQSRADAFRFVPQLGVSVSTPLVNVFGTRFNRRDDAIVDHRQLAPIERELVAAIGKADAARALIDSGPATQRAHDALQPGSDVCQHLDDYEVARQAARALLQQHADLRPDHRADVDSLDLWPPTDHPVLIACELAASPTTFAAHLERDARTQVAEITADVAAARQVIADLQPYLATDPRDAQTALARHLGDLTTHADDAEQAAALALPAGAAGPVSVATAADAVATTVADVASGAATLTDLHDATHTLLAHQEQAAAQREQLVQLLDQTPDASSALRAFPIDEEDAWKGLLTDAREQAARMYASCARLAAADLSACGGAAVPSGSVLDAAISTHCASTDLTHAIDAATTAARHAILASDTAPRKDAWDALDALDKAYAGANPTPVVDWAVQAADTLPRLAAAKGGSQDKVIDGAIKALCEAKTTSDSRLDVARALLTP